MASKKTKVIVCGAGIGGLTLAHELSKRGIDVAVYERNNAVGGLARSKYYKDQATSEEYPVEYSWRVYGDHYKNLLRLLSEIPLRKKASTSVFNKMVEVFTYVFPRFDKEEVVVRRGRNVIKLTENFEPGDKRKILNKVLYCMTMSTDRMDSLDHIRWKDFCADLSPEAQKYMVRLWGPVLGMDPSHMSFPVIARLIKVILGSFMSITGSLFLMPKPTNDAWFDEWTDYLQKNKVEIKTNHEIQDFKIENGRISKVLVKDLNQDRTFEDEADYYICGLSAEAIAKITANSPELLQVSALKNTIEMAQKSRQIMLSVQVFLDQKIIYPTDDNLILDLPDAPWALTIEPQDKIWGNTYSTNEKVKTVMSVAICQTDMPGIVHGKPFTKCTKKEIQDEVWAQIIKSYRMSSIKTEKGEPIQNANVELFYMWDSYYFDEDKKEIDVWEPKFSNNINTLRYQPNYKTEIPNFLFATSYTKTTRFIYSMESAVEAGTLSANEIIRQHNEKYGTNLGTTDIHQFSASSFIFQPLIWLDKLLLNSGRPHLSRFTFGSSLFLSSFYLMLLLALPLGLVALLIVIFI